MKGWISLNRQIQQHWIYSEKRIFSKYEAWIDMLFMASHSDHDFIFGNNLIKQKEGEFITSEIKLMDKWMWSKSKTRAFLQLLQNEKMIDKKTDHKKTDILILNYTKYQNPEPVKIQLKDHRKTSKEPVKDTINKDNKENKENNTSKEVEQSSEPTYELLEKPLKKKEERLDITRSVEYFKKELGGTLDGSISENRRYASLLIGRLNKDYPNFNSEEQIRYLIDAGRKDGFHSKNLTNFKYLYNNSQKIIQSVKSTQSRCVDITNL